VEDLPRGFLWQGSVQGRGVCGASGRGKGIIRRKVVAADVRSRAEPHGH